MDSGTVNYRRFLAGDEDGLAEIIREYKDGLILYLNGFTGDLHRAEELAEDTFVKLGIRKPKDKNKGSFRTWLYTIGRNAAIDALRRKKHLRECSINDCPPTAEEESLERAYLREERKILLHSAIRRLKPEYRQVLWLIYFEEFSYKQTAKIMRKTVHGTETLAYRARLALKKELEQEGITDEDL